MKPQIIGTGLSGLVGSRLTELLSDNFDFKDLSYDTGVDITNAQQVESIFRTTAGKIVLHMAAKADVDACEHDKPLGKSGAAWKINVEGTRNIVEAAGKLNKKVIYISTDFVFAGNKDEYRETDKPNPVNWYGVTKYEGEKIVLAHHHNNLVVRIAYPYRATNATKADFLHTIARLLSEEKELTVVEDHTFTPTFIDNIASAMKLLIDKNAVGIYHVVGSSSLSPLTAATQVADIFGFNKALIRNTTIRDYYQNKAVRPKTLRISNQKLANLGYTMLSFESGLQEIKQQGFRI